MNDESFIDVDSVLDKPEKWARESLRNDGLSDTFVDAWIQMDSGLDLEVALKLVTSESEYKMLMIQYIEKLRDRLSTENQSPMEWIWDGYLLAWFQFTGSMNESEKIWFSELQAKRGGGPRNRTSLAQKAINCVLQEADEFPGTVQLRCPKQQLSLDNERKGALPMRGLDLERFRHFVGKDNRIKVDGATIEITSVEDTKGKIIGYVFENRDLPSNENPDMTPLATIRSIISRRNSQPSRQVAWSE